MTTYADGDAMLARYDARLLGELVRDDQKREADSSLPTHANMLIALSDAYGEIVSNIAVGARYTMEQIDPENLSESGLSFLTRLQCDLALRNLKRRRGKLDIKADAEFIKELNNRLQSLQDGKSILLGVDDGFAKASLPSVGQPELIQVDKRNTIRFNTHNYYPQYPYNGRNQQISGQ